jgi:thiosulfate/3-mercaptopyruvate sulfurtransferase
VRTKQILLLGLLVAGLLAGGWSALLTRGQDSVPPELFGAVPTDPWQAKDQIKPEELAKSLLEGGKRPLVLFVGFPVLYQGGHIVDSQFIGPTAKPEGLQTLKRMVQGLPREKTVVLYCGCCPLADCPNIRPAFSTMKDLGFKNVKILYLPNNFQKDWIARGLPIQKGGEDVK